jgi:hypothetical protein
MICSKNISFVVQGAIFNNQKKSTFDVIKSIKKYFPSATIILSTWVGQDVNANTLELVDIVVKSDDPGDLTPSGSAPLNINRQIVSSKKGIKYSKTLYTIKTRTDLIFTSNRICYLLAKQYKKNLKFQVGQGRLLITDVSSRHHLRGLNVSFWLCDFIYCGFTVDLKKFFDVKRYPEDYFDYFLTHKTPNYFLDKSHPQRYVPESYLTYNYLHELCGNIKFDNTFHREEQYIALYNKLLINNFIVYTPVQLSISSLKYRFPMLSRKIIFTNNDWLNIYNKEFDQNIPTSMFSELSYIVRYVIIRFFLGRNK